MLLTQISRHINENSERTALVFNGQSYSYEYLRGPIENLRGALKTKGIERGDRVAIMLPNSPHFVICYLAVLGLGAVCVPINALHKAREIRMVLDDAEPRAFIGWSNTAAESEKALAQLESLQVKIYLGDDLPSGAINLLELYSRNEEPAAIEDEDEADLAAIEDEDEADLAAIMYTAGVSGYPRGVELTHGNFSSNMRELNKCLRVRETDRVLCCLPYSNICGLTTGVHLSLAAGASLQIHSRFHPGDALHCICDQQTTIFVGNPASFAMISGFPSVEKSDFGHIRYAICCESRLSDSIRRDVEEKMHLKIFDAYGTTETCGIVAINLFPQLVAKGSVGQPIGGHEVAIFDADNNRAKTDVVGRIAVRGPSIMKGYRNRPDKNQRAFFQDWFFSGDHGVFDEQCNLYIKAHHSEVIMKGGFPIYCREVEEIVEGLPHIQDVAVVGIPDSIFGEEIKACVVLKEGAIIGPSEIIEYVKERIAIYKCPKIVKLYKELPRSTDGKLMRSQLLDERQL